MKDNSYSRDVESKERMNKRQQQRLAKIYHDKEFELFSEYNGKVEEFLSRRVP